MNRGEELDVAAVDAWLRAAIPELQGMPEVIQYRGGASNWTYRLRYQNRDLVLRRPPAGTKAKSAHDMGREYLVQKTLLPVFPYVPRVLGLCEDESVLGVPFYVMERVPGLILRRDLPAGMRLSPQEARALSVRLVETLAELHRVDYRAAGLESLGKGPGYARRQIEGWSDRYQRARTWNAPSFRRVRDWLAASTPDDVRACIIHNDWRLDNAVLAPEDPTRIAGVLDWEMATIGDPLMDLGNALAYWVERGDGLVMSLLRRQPSHLPGMLTRKEIVDLYLERTGLRVASWAFYEVYGLFRLAAIAQQIYFRYHRGESRNPAFRHFWLIVHALERRCLAVLRKER